MPLNVEAGAIEAYTAKTGRDERALEADAVVIGAGIAGSSLACALAKRGWDTVLIDKGKFPRHKACGEFLSPESRASLRALGLEEAVRAYGPTEMTHARLHSDRGATLTIPLPGAAWGISRYALDAQLQTSAQAAGVRFFSGCAVRHVEPADGGGYLVECGGGKLEEQRSIRARIVIGAGGRHMGEVLGARKPSARERTYIGIKTHLSRADGSSSPHVDLYFFRGGYIGIAPIEGERFNVAALVQHSAYPKLPASAAIVLILEQASRHIPALKERLAGATLLPGTQAAAFPVTIRSVPRAWSDMPLIGDAAAVIPPFCGDGMAMALRSAELCAPLADAYLRGESTLSEWRETYTRSIREQFTGALRWGERLERVLNRHGLSSLLLRFGMLAPAVAERIVRSTRLKE